MVFLRGAVQGPGSYDIVYILAILYIIAIIFFLKSEINFHHTQIKIIKKNNIKLFDHYNRQSKLFISRQHIYLPNLR